MTAERRCGVQGPSIGCCKAENHTGQHCAHPGEQLTGTAGVLVASRVGPTFKTCDGTANPCGDRLHPAVFGAREAEHWVLDPNPETTGDIP